MKVIVEPEAEEDLKQFEEEHQRYVLEQLEELSNDPTGHKKSDTIRVGGRPVFKYVMKENGRGGKDYRAVYDIRDNQVRVVAIFHRDKGYDKDELEGRI